MSDVYEIKWIGWNNELKGSTQHDKVWGWLQMADGRYYCFWGRRGGTLKFKEHSCHYDVTRVQQSKPKKGYKFVDPKDYNTLVDDFVLEVELWCAMAILSETVKPK